MSEPVAGVTIRLVTAGDTDAILALWSRVFPEYADPAFPQRDPRASIERKLAFGDGRFWVAVLRTAGGAERIAPRWWEAEAGPFPAGERAYVVATTAAGRRLWMFLETASRRWFVHGEWA